MKKTVNIITGLLLIAIGAVSVISFNTVLNFITYSTPLHFLFLAYTLYIYYINSNSSNHIKVFLASAGFMITVVLFTVNNFKFAGLNQVINWSVLLVPSVSLLFTYLCDKKEFLFLKLFIAWLLIGSILYFVLPSGVINSLTRNFIGVLLNAFPFLLIALGILTISKKSL